MSFSSRTKDDLVKLRIKRPSQRLAQLGGITLACGSLSIGRNGTGASYTTESLPVGRQIAEFANERYKLDTSLELSEQERRKRPLLNVTLTGVDAETLLVDAGMLIRTAEGVTLQDGISPRLTESDEDARAFLRGVFLGSGSCLNPARGYHLELVTRTEDVANGLIALIERFGLVAKCHSRKDRQIVYLKGEDVAGFLALIGASSAALAFENVRAEREFRNYVNRKSNCETANIGKTVDAAMDQVQAIETIEAHMELGKLPPSLYEAAMLRLSHPEATLQELADLAEIGKSGMNHRLTRLINMAKDLGR